MDNRFSFEIKKNKEEIIERNLLFYEYVPKNSDLGKITKINFYNKTYIADQINDYILKFKNKLDEDKTINIVPQKSTNDIENKLKDFKNSLEYKNKIAILELNKNYLGNKELNIKINDSSKSINNEKIDKKIKIENLIEKEFLIN